MKIKCTPAIVHKKQVLKDSLNEANILEYLCYNCLKCSYLKPIEGSNFAEHILGIFRQQALRELCVNARLFCVKFEVNKSLNLVGKKCFVSDIHHNRSPT